ncbi:MAG: SET domain-containing protein-lysine N-methyltransferase [Rhizobiaceae bacterium]
MLMKEPTWDINGMISYRNTPEMGLGIFATRLIVERTEITCNPVRTYKDKDAELLRKTDAYRMMFVDRDIYGPNGSNPPIHLVLGSISMLNHGDKENCMVLWELNEVKPEMSQAKLIAMRDINPGEQLLMKYHNFDEYDF